MKHIVGPCVISALVKQKPDPAMIEHLESIKNERLFLSVITIGELEKGIAELPDSKRKRQLVVWLDQHLIDRYEDRLIPFGRDCARRWGQIQGSALSNGRVLPVVDAMIAATALTENLTVITRNTRDMERCGAPTLNPWTLEV